MSLVLLLLSIQIAFKARSYLYSAADVEAWHGSPSGVQVAILMQQQQLHFRNWRRTEKVAIRLHNGGVMFLGLGAAFFLAAPEDASTGHAIFRWSAAAVVSMVTLVGAVIAVVDRRGN
ncbi:hypothetical protein [Streptomyces sp. Tu 3180]|uniref:hypothetical protein n=1 Tax=Streptomyces sp. Tu 3180 TaxID=2682611 RepID=UPI001359C9FE|nr:hypothetical protein [Streptomyces sp. Tu 3180]KAF3465469.1 hypothetical protein GL259_14735 [Streptomyces sp. Tu 3180]